MITPHPQHFEHVLTDDRLNVLAKALLEECFTTEDDLQSSYDSGYSRGCTRFDRQKNKLKLLALEHRWLTISDGSNRLVMAIEGLPFRFARDQHNSPRKPATLLVSQTEAIQHEKFVLESQMEMDFDGVALTERVKKPTFWRFFVEVSESLEDGRDFNIYFVGFNELKQQVCVWEYDNKVAVVTSVDETRHEAVDLLPAEAKVPQVSVEKQVNDKQNKDSPDE
ncbi:hypothetical protein [Rahnella contaminans]|uniref:hypothetical protein n=1 Tax=Rahnella contaminans TaxID=2703882 RepID=UPI0023DC2184|nr:hypothetical protein [Rahnella contaminans]MDF1895554.1 hypothetical protein [Rahnella contaminans]